MQRPLWMGRGYKCLAGRRGLGPQGCLGVAQEKPRGLGSGDMGAEGPCADKLSRGARALAGVQARPGLGPRVWAEVPSAMLPGLGESGQGAGGRTGVPAAGW